MDINERIVEFVRVADQKSADYWQRCNYIHTPPPTHQAEISDKWCKVFTYEEHSGIKTKTCIYAFIAMRDFSNKALGNIKAGGVYKPATYAAPAKHERGNIFREDFGNWLTEFGPVYLK